jgi:hypothetical protein
MSERIILIILLRLMLVRLMLVRLILLRIILLPPAPVFHAGVFKFTRKGF